MRVIRTVLIVVSLLSFLHAGIFDLIKDIFKPKQNQPQQQQERTIQREEPPSQIEEFPTENEIIIEEGEEEEQEQVIEKIPFPKYPYSYKIAFILPKKLIGKYSVTTVNATIAYLLKREINFKIDVFDIKDGNFDTLNRVLSKIESRGYHLVIAPVTRQIARNICSLYIKKLIYIPTVNKNSLSCDDPNVYFGGIDYNRQFLALAKRVRDKNAVLVYDTSPFISTLNSFAQNYFFIKKRIIVKDIKNLKNTILANKKSLQNSTVLLNTPLVKTALLLSDLYFYSIKPKYFLSTQINYDPHIFLLTQYKTRENMLIANSIFETYIKYSDASEILNSNIKFDKVNYATMNGLDYFFVNSYRDRGRIFKEKVYDNQIYYNIEIVSPVQGKFIRK
ncbi:MAG: hypothetical protein GXO31_05875 [Epsilonproteobacteria bacterium]|nr:hypothetical protein [Campylobacterota bacterium]